MVASPRTAFQAKYTVSGGYAKTPKEALLQRRVVVLCDLREIALLIEQEADIREFLRKKIQAAIVDKNPYSFPGLASAPSPG
jgi:hypothetical protein